MVEEDTMTSFLEQGFLDNIDDEVQDLGLSAMRVFRLL
jgi:hypothetical protein